MDAQDNGLTLQGLAQRLETLERENKELRQKVTALEGSGPRPSVVAAVGGSGPRSAEEAPAEPHGSEGRVSRGWLLSRAGVAALGVVAAGALTQRDVREAKATPTSFTTNTSERGAVEGTNTSPTGYGMWGNSSFVGVNGTGVWGVTGTSDPGDGSSGVGVQGNHRGSGAGVMGDSQSGRGVLGRSFGGATGAVEGEHFGRGYGGQFKGGRAQLRLVPGSRPGRPGGAHSKGEIYMDSAGALFVCIRGGTPGTWRKVSTAATS